MELNTTPDISLQIIEHPNPLLLYPRWIEISFPNDNETLAQQTISINESKIRKLSEAVGALQIKTKTPSSWNNPGKQKFVPTVYNIQISTKNLCSVADIDIEILKVNSFEDFLPLVADFISNQHKVEPSYFANPTPTTLQRYERYAHEMIQLGNGFILLAKKQGEPVGFLFAENGREVGKIDSLFVSEGHRDKGIGTALISAARFNFVKYRQMQVKTYVPVKCTSLTFFDQEGFSKDEVQWIYNIDQEN